MISSVSNTIGVGGFAIICGIFFAGYFIGLAAGKTEARAAVKDLARIRDYERHARMKSHHYRFDRRRYEWEHNESDYR